MRKFVETLVLTFFAGVMWMLGYISGGGAFNAKKKKEKYVEPNVSDRDDWED